ncbi:MAG: hypothetical protein AB1750_14310 [Chloroflexota bacterium]
MKLRNMYLLNTALALLFALGLLLMTDLNLEMFGFTITSDTQLLAKFIAVELTVGGLVTLFARDVTDPKARSAINLSILAASVLGFIVSLDGTLSGVMSVVGYLPTAIYAILAIGFAYFQFFAPPEQA